MFKRVKFVVNPPEELKNFIKITNANPTKKEYSIKPTLKNKLTIQLTKTMTPNVNKEKAIFFMIAHPLKRLFLYFYGYFLKNVSIRQTGELKQEYRMSFLRNLEYYLGGGI
jgi:hypothetical protein